MNGIKIAFGILLLGVAIWLIERLLPGAVGLLLWAAWPSAQHWRWAR